MSDVDAISRVCSKGWRHTYGGIYSPQKIEQVIDRFYSTDRIRKEVGSPEGWDGWWVAEDDSRQVVAAGGGGLTAPGVGQVFVLYADPERRGEGAGLAFLNAITEEQRRLGAREQWVSVEPENEKGLPFYRARGFVERGRRPAHEREGFVFRLRREI